MRRFLFWSIGISLLLMLLTWDVILALGIEEMVKSFREKYEKTGNFSADFEQTTFVAGRKRVASGKLHFQKPNLLRQEYFDPSNPENMTQLIVSDGQTVWSYTPLINQVTKVKLVQDELLPGFGQSLENVEKNYSLSFVADELAEKRGVHVVELIPRKRDGNSEFIFDVLQVWIGLLVLNDAIQEMRHFPLEGMVSDVGAVRQDAGDFHKVVLSWKELRRIKLAVTKCAFGTVDSDIEPVRHFGIECRCAPADLAVLECDVH